MKNWSPALQAHYAQRVTTLADCWRIQPVQRAGAEPLGFTSHQRDLVVDGLTYQSVAFTPSDARSTAELSVDTMELEAFFHAKGITQADIDAGVLDSAEVENFEVDYTAGEWEGEASAGGTTTTFDSSLDASDQVGWELHWLTGANAGTTSILQSYSGGTYTLTAALDNEVSAGDTFRLRKGRNVKLSGTIGQVRYNAEGVVIFELDSLARQLQQTATSSVQPACLNEFGDEWCQVDLAPLTVEGSVTTVVSRSEFGDTARDEEDSYFRGGVLFWTGGDNEGYRAEVRSYADGRLVLVNPMPFPLVEGDTYTVRPTCWKRLFEDCRDRWDNVVNFRGFPNLPGRRALYAGPDR